MAAPDAAVPALPVQDRLLRRDDRGVHDPLTDVVILKLSSCVMGMVVDGVTDIVSLAQEQILPIPGAANVDYLLGVGEVDGRCLIVVDIDKLMAIRKIQLGARQAA